LEKGKGGMRMVSADGTMSPFELDEVEWKPDTEVNMCQASDCTTGFSFMVRKHHCRRCGNVFCDKCMYKTLVPRLLYNDPQRVCKACKETCDFELTFFTKMIPVLRSGGKFDVTHDGNAVGPLFVSLSADNTVVRFTATTKKDAEDRLAPLKVQTIHVLDDKDKTTVSLKTKEEGTFTLKTEDKKLAQQWRKATRHVVKILHPKSAQAIRRPSSAEP